MAKGRLESMVKARLEGMVNGLEGMVGLEDMVKEKQVKEKPYALTIGGIKTIGGINRVKERLCVQRTGGMGR